jgi:hypothetical protein
MPRDLQADKGILEGMPKLTRDSKSESASPNLPATSPVDEKRDKLHPYVQTLNMTDLKSCVALENACFSAEEAASPEKVRDINTSPSSSRYVS